MAKTVVAAAAIPPEDYKMAQRKFKDSHPQRYRPMPVILETTAREMMEAIALKCGTRHPKVREVGISVDYKGAIPVASIRSRFRRKWTKEAQFPVERPENYNFVPVR